MKVTFEDLLANKSWLHRELLSSLSTEVFEEATKDRFFEVQILVNGKIFEPKILNDLITNIADFVDKEAILVAKEKFSGLYEKANKISEAIEEAIESLKRELPLDPEDRYENT